MNVPGVRPALRAAARLFVALSRSRLTAPTLAHVVAWWLASRVSSIGKPGGKDVPILFALSRIRVLPDAKALTDAGQFTILTLPDTTQFTLQAPFFPGSIDPSKHFVDPVIAERAALYRAFLARMLPLFLRRIGAQAVIGAHFMYPQDIHWGASAQKAGVPYIILFRESLKLSDSEREALVAMCRRLGRFEGELILTWNDVARDCILAASYARPEQVRTTGTVRLSKFISLCRQGTPPLPPGPRQTATLFSFNPGASLNGLALDPWPRNVYEGWVRLFERSHTAFAVAAQAEPGARFVIKPKWGGMWNTRIVQALESRGITPASVPNLEIDAGKNPNDLIVESAVVVGFTSTTLLEAGLAGRHIIIPDFEEALDPYFSHHIKLREIYPMVVVAGSPEELTARVLEALRTPRPLADSAKQGITHYFSKFVSPADEDPMRASVAAIRQAISKRTIDLAA